MSDDEEKVVEKKRGVLHTDERNYIKQNCFDMSIADIAEALNRNEASVRKFIETSNLKATDLTDAQKIINDLKSRYYYKELESQFNENEMMMFQQNWVDMILQFGQDVTKTEESQIKELLRIEILIDRCMKDRREAEERIEEIEEMKSIERSKDLDDQNIDILTQLVDQQANLVSGKSAYIGEYKTLSEKKEKYLRELKGTRDQRKKNTEDAKTNFDSWLRSLTAPEIRSQLGFDMIVNKIAADKATQKISELHTYMDNGVDRPLLNQYTIQDGDEED